VGARVPWPTKYGSGSRQQTRRQRSRFGTIEIDISETVGLWAKENTNILESTVEILVNILFSYIPPLPVLLSRPLFTSYDRDYCPPASDVLLCDFDCAFTLARFSGIVLGVHKDHPFGMAVPFGADAPRRSVSEALFVYETNKLDWSLLAP
jgi:hypothetical protein